MELTTSYCPNPHCTHYGKRGFGTHLVHRGADRGIPRLLCTRCDGTFSARQGTAYFGVRAEEPNYTTASERCRTDARMIRRETVQSEQFFANPGS